MKATNFLNLDKFLQIDLKHNTKNITLHYALMNNRVTNQWLSLIENDILENKTLSQNFRRKLSEIEIEELFQEFLFTIDLINSKYDTQLYRPLSFKSLDDDILNFLHNEFENYGTRIDALIEKNNFHVDVHENFLKLNNLIHTLQDFKKTDKIPARICTNDFIPVNEKIKLQPEDYFLLTSDQEWGWIYLGYNTLGKSWTAVSLDDDLISIKENRVKPQKEFSSEFVLNFHSAEFLHWKRFYLYKWWIDNNVSELVNPEMLVSDLGLGNIPLAVLMAYSDDDIIVLKNNFNQEKFNCEIWDQSNGISDIRIVDEKQLSTSLLDALSQLRKKSRS